MKTKSQILRDHVLHDSPHAAVYSIAREYFLKEIPFGKHKSKSVPELAAERASIAAWLHAIANTRPRQMKILGFSNATEFHTIAFDELNREALSQKWDWRCKTLKSLQKRLTPFSLVFKGKFTYEQAFVSIMPDFHRFGNKNPRKITDEQIQTIGQLYLQVSPYTSLKKLHRQYLDHCQAMIKECRWMQGSCITLETYKKHLYKILTTINMSNHEKYTEPATAALDEAIFIGIRTQSDKTVFLNAIEIQKDELSARKISKAILSTLAFEKKRLADEHDQMSKSEKLNNEEMIHRVGLEEFSKMYRAKFGREYSDTAKIKA